MSVESKIEPIEVSLSSVWMMQPEYGSFRRALESKGYTLKDLSNAIGPSMILATKGSVEISTNIERRTIAIRSETSTSDLLTAYSDIEQINLALGTEPTNVIFYEFIGIFVISSTQSPLKTISGLKLEKDALRKIGTILGKDLEMFGLPLAIRGGNPTSGEWFSLVIEPLYVSANKKYRLQVVYRGRKEDIVGFVKTVEKRAIKVIEELEGSV
jgi:hypothetical protein